MSTPDKIKVMKQTLELMKKELRKLGLQEDNNIMACLDEAYAEIDGLGTEPFR